jgi:WhiB family redox-sensing transcriptional regulator
MTATSPASPASATVIPPHQDPARPADAALGPWITRASCAREDTGIFFPPADSPATEARRICAGCPVRRLCLSYALAAGEEHGIWGGLDPRERKNLKRRQQRRRASGRLAKAGAA